MNKIIKGIQNTCLITCVVYNTEMGIRNIKSNKTTSGREKPMLNYSVRVRFWCRVKRRHTVEGLPYDGGRGWRWTPGVSNPRGRRD